MAEKLPLVVFIMCAGDGERWSNFLNRPKQLAEFYKEPILMRMLRLVEAHNPSKIYIVVRNREHFREISDLLVISESDSLLESIQKTSTYWGERNVFLLGDVFFSKSAISSIFSSSRKLLFWGRPWPSAYVKCDHGELFALSFHDDFSDQLLGSISEVLSINGSRIVFNLWNLYQHVSGLRYGSSRLNSAYLTPVDDFTNDIDCPKDYLKMRWLYDHLSSGDVGNSWFQKFILLNTANHFILRLIWIVLSKGLDLHFLKMQKIVQRICKW